MLDERQLLQVLQLVALSLPAIAILLQFSVSSLELLKKAYRSGDNFITVSGKTEITEHDVGLQNGSVVAFQLSLSPLVFSGILLLVTLLLYQTPNTSPTTLISILEVVSIALIVMSFLLVIAGSLFTGGRTIQRLIEDFQSRIKERKDPEKSKTTGFNPATDKSILEFLDNKNSGELVADSLLIAENTKLSRKTVGERIQLLVEYDFVDYYDESESLFQLSEKGRKYLAGELDASELEKDDT